MTDGFTYDVTPDFAEIRLCGSRGPIAVDRWAIEASNDVLSGVDLAQRLVAAGTAVADGETLFVEHATVSGLSRREAAILGLPERADVLACIETSGLLTQPIFTASLRWQRTNGQPILGATRCGAFLQVGGKWQLIPDALYQIAEAIDRLGEVDRGDEGARMGAIAALTEALPQAGSAVDSPNILSRMTIAVADSFSLDLVGEGASARLIPILYRSSDEGDRQLLSDPDQGRFGNDEFNRFQTARAVYSLGAGKFLVLSPPLRRALAEVRRLQSAPLTKKRALLASPGAFLRQALGDDADEPLIETVFRETQAYSDRVLGLGLWAPRVLPWISLPPTNWFGPEIGGGVAASAPVQSGILIGDRRLALGAQAADDLRSRIETAIASGSTTVPLQVDGETVSVPANHDVLAALNELERAHAKRAGAFEGMHDRDALDVLLIIPNEAQVELEGEFAPRLAPKLGEPSCLGTLMKPHQKEGLAWLQEAWIMGRPGVLLADDMGLGKTLQALAFLAWLREGMCAGDIERAPLLIVAPTGLLENWRAEHDRHLRSPGLGTCLRAYGKALGVLRSKDSNGTPVLDESQLAAADWVLTTYETLRDYDRSFGRIRFAAALFDEAQKIKTPGVRVTDAAKAMNAQFRIAMSGTPVENRLADLWCIVDGVHPACLGDLKSFSAEYERTPDLEGLKRLKASLELPLGGRPPLLLRRLKADHLPDLPPCEERVVVHVMPPQQAARYDAMLSAARGSDRRGAVLEALQALRRVCLHPDVDSDAGDAEFIAGSARLKLAFETLDTISDRNERALIFIDDLAVQARLVGILQRRYALSLPPMIINGQVSGSARQARVDRFQSQAAGFDVMLLSPRAGGVGLTLTSANHVVHLSRWWNPAVEDQCTGRVLRIGQQRPVFVHIPIATLPNGRRSFDENLHALLGRKRQLMREALLPPGATEADREELLSATLGSQP